MTAAPSTVEGPSSPYPTRNACRRARAAWCLFDFASSSYTTLIMTVVFSVYFREVIVAAQDNSGDRLWGNANFVAMLIVALASPVLGAVADESSRKKLLLVMTTLLAVAATSLLYFVTPGDVASAMLLYVLATVGFEAGYVFYNAFLLDVSTPATIGRVSGYGWALGFAGGLTALLLCYPWIASELRTADGGLSSDAVQGRRFSFVTVGAFYLVFALPAFLWLREFQSRGPSRSAIGYAAQGFRNVARTFSRLREHREIGKFILASLFFNDGITTVIVFAAPFAVTSFGFSSGEIITLFVVMQLVAIPTTLLAGRIADRIGARYTLMLTLLLWVAVVLLAFAAQGKPMFWAVAVGAASGMGSTQAVGRSFMAQISPANRQAEFFGFYVTSGKFAAVTGPLIFGHISAWTGSQRLAVLSLLPLFAIGLALLYSIDETAARRGPTRAPSRP